MEKSIVVIADIVDSRQIQAKEREKVQEQLSEVLDELNTNRSTLISPYTITLGDEFQAVHSRADTLCIDMLKILAELHPVALRFSIGVGAINTEINTKQALGMDGPAFHIAREGIGILKETGFLFRLNIEGEDCSLIPIINGSLQMLSRQLQAWNKNRIRILHMLKEGHDYKHITETLDISEPAFYKNKNAGLLDVISTLCDNIANVINQKMES